MHGLTVDCTGEGEIAISAAAGVSKENILVHGVNKSKDDLNAAIIHASTIVVDNLSELHRLKDLLTNTQSVCPNLWLRLLPGVSVTTHHAHTQTGHHESKFGMTYEEIIADFPDLTKEDIQAALAFSAAKENRDFDRA